jgi:AraC family transcriptional activator of tynA and feaB
MSTANRGQNYQRWLAKINQVCGHLPPVRWRIISTARLTPAMPAPQGQHGHRRGVNLLPHPQEIKRDNDAWFYTVFQLAGQAAIEQDDRQVMLEAAISR